MTDPVWWVPWLAVVIIFTLVWIALRAARHHRHAEVEPQRIIRPAVEVAITDDRRRAILELIAGAVDHLELAHDRLDEALARLRDYSEPTP